MAMNNDPTSPERPKLEPEIIPPSRGSQSPFQKGDWSGGATYRVRVTRIGPFRLFLWVLTGLLITAGVLFLLAGALIIAVPVIAAIVVGSMIFARFRKWGM
jgi:hypothetical protein